MTELAKEFKRAKRMYAKCKHLANKSKMVQILKLFKEEETAARERY